MTKVMEGIRVPEVAQHTFAPSTGAILADWGADVSLLDLARDGQALASDMLFEVESVDGGPRMMLARGPVRFDHAPVQTTRSPQASERAEIVPMELGMEWQRIEELKAKGAIA